MRDYHLRYRFGISLSAFEFLSCLQLSKCAICKNERKLCVDHNHNTNEFRGLICKPCNCAIGIRENHSGAWKQYLGEC